MLGSITRACAQRGYDLLISFQQLSTTTGRQDYEDSRKADGIILLGYGDYHDYRSRLEHLVEQGTHFVRWGAVLTGQAEISVGCDNCQGGYDVARAPARPRRAAASPSSATPRIIIRNSSSAIAAIPRRSLRGVGPMPACRSTRSHRSRPGIRGRRASCSRAAWSSTRSSPPATSSRSARCTRCRNRGLERTGHVAVVGFDDIPPPSLINPPLTTVTQDTRLAGETLVDTLLRLVTEQHAEGTVLPTELIVRRSCGAATSQRQQSRDKKQTPPSTRT